MLGDDATSLAGVGGILIQRFLGSPVTVALDPKAEHTAKAGKLGQGHTAQLGIAKIAYPQATFRGSYCGHGLPLGSGLGSYCPLDPVGL